MEDRSATPAMFVIAEQSGQIIVPDPNQSPYEVDVAVRAGHLQNVITHLSALSRANGFLKHDELEIAAGRTHASAKMRENVEHSRPVYRRNAKLEFLQATGLVELIDAGELSEKEAKKEAKSMYEHFIEQYYGPEQYLKAQAFRRQLVAIVDKAEESKVTTINRAQKLRPHKQKASVDKLKTESDALDTRKRLKAIAADPRAGFLPTTHREKNQVLTFLDYLDNPDYPFGVSNQLLEVFNKSQANKRHNPSIDSERGPLSITFEFIDYLHSSIVQLETLQQIQVFIHALPNRRVTLGDETDWLDLNHPGFRSLVRYVDLAKFMKEGEVAGIKDPLLTRLVDRDKSKEKHKTVTDIYTSKQKADRIEQYIQARIQNMTVGEALDNIDAAIEDQVKRSGFMLRRLQDIAVNHSGMSYLAAQMLERPRQVAAESVAAVQAG